METDKLTDIRGEWTSASAAPADALCAGRHLFQKAMPDTSSKDSTHGDLIHAALARQSIEGLTPDQERSYEMCNQITAHLDAYAFPNGAGEIPPPVREQRLWIKWADGLMHSGQLDFYKIVGWRALIIEFKSLPGDVPAGPGNLQLRDQAVLLKQAAPGLKEIITAVAQPLVTMTPEICMYQEEHLARALEELYLRVHRSNQPNGQRTAGETQCKFCKAKTKCPEYSQWAGAMVAPKKEIVRVPFSEWTPQMRAEFMALLPAAESWLATCKSEIKKMLKADPASVPGFRLDNGRSMSAIINPNEVHASFVREGGTTEAFMKCIEIKKGKFEEQVRAFTKLKGAKLDKAVKDIIGNNLEEKRSEPSIEKIK
jgi:hypothetical protein